ncbi:hypothetical protein VITU102760_21840 [Vibrio tubiashii]|uniref:GAPS4 PD-(D/E)XK nuclease domain-containing protein n=1 Tax=Vibrio tubiashii ATCC 19109 TaxID=1051646 RepID=F9TC42_9VIBR|nr:hypothetical protein [Vibrio tubiashii]AIW15087.1 hypothetical protein IX91_13065 [Vibrio tubiashii ATCC 19109]EGU48179.1 hypothetical protein VITU9109_11915 [Vibrio tubiashii ATCC 19109]EIF05375.1 hypothetical protein VT1337_03805 [Vibrio tubiashii NCIMB 1337 = ATCC 19106]
MAENGPIEEVAKIVSSKLFERFKWSQYGPYDQDFPCRKENEHKPKDKQQKHTHPVDVVFSYKDPYLNKTIYLNTDLKSYAKASINVGMIEGALTSLANTIDCAQNSTDWQDKYRVCNSNFEVRGMLFVYNHDNLSKKDFYEFFYPPKPSGNRKRPKSVKLDKIKLPKNKQIHIIEPRLIDYMMTLVSDMNELISESTFPKDDYGFYYPQLTYHKVTNTKHNLPATIELLASPFLIIKHGPVEEYDKRKGCLCEVSPEGFIVYYNREGSKDLEFLYLLDTLSKFQILDGSNRIQIRVAHPNRDKSIRTNFRRAVEKYAHDWGYDEEAKEYLDSIQLTTVPLVKQFYCTEEISWSRDYD